jgi:alkaline phosphatase D
MKSSILFFILIFSFNIYAQDVQKPTAANIIISGPMLGYVEHREAMLWLELSSDARNVQVKYWDYQNPKIQMVYTYVGILGKKYNPIKIQLKNLEMNTKYAYQIWVNGKNINFDFPTTFKTKEIWEFRKDAPDFSFLTGSCVYVNDTQYDRPGKPYGNSMQILETMAKDSSEFMIWMGDNLYYREADFSSESGMEYRYSYNFSKPEFQKLRATRSNYAIWDDHDFGPNDSNSSFELKEKSLQLFKSYWPNKTFGQSENDGVYHKFSYSDVDFLMLDDRYHRYSNNLADSIEGKPNQDKLFYGRTQLDWIKNQLLSSRATFKIIVNGGQMLNKMADKECFVYFSAEWNELMNFIDDNNIKGIVFLTGDRHYSEVIRHVQKNSYQLYEFTCSSLTSGIHDITKEEEFYNPQRIPNMLAMVNNYGKISVSGPKNKRVISMQTIDSDGKVLFTFKLNENDLKKRILID